MLRRHDASSSFDSHAFPERNAVLDFRGRGFWVGVIPGGVLIPHAVHFDMVIARRALPRTNGSVVARPEKFFFHRFQRKVLIPFHDHAGIAFGNHFSSPRRFRHFVPPLRKVSFNRIPLRRRIITLPVARGMRSSRNTASPQAPYNMEKKLC